MKRKENKSKKLFEIAQKYLVGGVNSPVRSFRGVRRNNPLFISRAKGSKLYDEDGNEYIDYMCSWGASILGAAHPQVVKAVCEASKRGLTFGASTKQEVKLAEIIQESVPSLELMRLVSSGTEATMSAVRAARAYTRKDKIIKFEGCYHGHSDQFLVKAGSGLSTFSTPDSAGVPESVANQTLVARFNDIDSVERLLQSDRGKVAAIIVEPVAGNMGVVPPKTGFLEALRKLCDENEVLLIFDEVITGYRVSRGGAQALHGVRPDMTCLGKIIGGGMNIAAYGGRQEIMKLVSPLGPVYQAGTLAGNPLSVAAGIATLSNLSPKIYSKLERSSNRMEVGLKKAAHNKGVDLVIQRVGSMIGIFFTNALHVEMYNDVLACSRDDYANLFSSLLDRGIYLPPSPFETVFVSAAHSLQEIDQTVEAMEESFGLLSEHK